MRCCKEDSDDELGCSLSFGDALGLGEVGVFVNTRVDEEELRRRRYRNTKLK